MDVFASGHGDDEFWYTNLPDQYAKKIGVPGGGCYRELQVFCDDIFAGSVYPFPVIYTGGVNPLLWRPLTGILSFDIVPYRFDLTPFASLFNDGNAHNITITIYDDNSKGFWYLDAVFVLYADYKDASVEGRLLKHVDSLPQVSVTVNPQVGYLSLYTVADHSYTIAGVVVYNFGNYSKSTLVSIRGTLKSENFNTISLDGAVQDTEGSLETIITTTVEGSGRSNEGKRVSRFYYPYDVHQEGTDQNNLLQIKANVLYSREREEKWLPTAGKFFGVTWKNTIGSSAFYNRSSSSDDLSHEAPLKLGRQIVATSRVGDIIYNQTDDSVETFFITSPLLGLCYTSEAHAKDGHLLSQARTYNCSFPTGIDFCGAELCTYL